MNLVITGICNRSCPYCFARGKMLPGTGAGPVYMSLDDFDKCLEFACRCPGRRLNILGGEPTLHPAFGEMTRRALDCGFSLAVFTNGLWPDPVREFIDNTDTGKVEFIFNINEPRMQSSRENDLQAESLRIAGSRGRIGFNIYREEFDLRFIPDLVDAFRLQSDVRLGLASPIFGHDNSHIPAGRLRRIGKSLADQLRELERRDVLCSFDCGIPLCMFDEEELGRVVLSTSRWESLCTGGIEVGPDLSVWPCFPLSGVFRVGLLDFENFEAVEAFFSEKLAPFRKFGSLDECATCRYLRRKQCCGGCLARTLLRLRESGDPRMMGELDRLAGGVIKN